MCKDGNQFSTGLKFRRVFHLSNVRYRLSSDQFKKWRLSQFSNFLLSVLCFPYFSIFSFVVVTVVQKSFIARRGKKREQSDLLPITNSFADERMCTQPTKDMHYLAAWQSSLMVCTKFSHCFKNSSINSLMILNNCFLEMSDISCHLYFLSFIVFNNHV